MMFAFQRIHAVTKLSNSIEIDKVTFKANLILHKSRNMPSIRTVRSLSSFVYQYSNTNPSVLCETGHTNSQSLLVYIFPHLYRLFEMYTKAREECPIYLFNQKHMQPSNF